MESTNKNLTGRVVAVAVGAAALSVALWLVWWPLGAGIVWAMARVSLEGAIAARLTRFGAEIGLAGLAALVGLVAGPVAFGLASLALCVALSLLLKPVEAAA